MKIQELVQHGNFKIHWTSLIEDLRWQQKQVGELEVKTIPNMQTGQLKKIKIKS